MRRSLAPVLVWTLVGSNVLAYEVRSFGGPAGRLAVDPKMPSPSGFTWGYVEFDRSVPCITAEERKAIQADLARSRAELTTLGKLPPADPHAVVSFQWPLAGAPDKGFYDEGYHGISNFVDQDLTAGLLDYDCNARTYDGHQGTDYFLWPFEWYKKNHQHVMVVAPADGTIILKAGFNADNHCSCMGGWNAVYLQHADGSVTWSGHLRNGGLTSKGVGQTVVAGERLGWVASSGCSTGPHLHLEVYDPSSNLIDPYAGTCNSLNATSWWQTQLPYYDSGINAVMTHSAPPVFPACPLEETLNEQLEFPAVSPTPWFGVYYRDQLSTQTSDYRIVQPDNTIWTSWSHSSDGHYAASYWLWTFDFGPAPPTGIWRFEVTYLGNTYTQLFGVGSGAVVGAQELAAMAPIELVSVPNPFSKATDVRFTLPVPGPAHLAVYDVGGQRVRTLLNSTLVAGSGAARWDGRDEDGIPVGAGIYFYRLESQGRARTSRVTILR